MRYCDEAAAVWLRDFAAWTQSVKWEIPPELAGLAACVQAPTTMVIEPLVPSVAIAANARGKVRRPSREKRFWPAAREVAVEWLVENGYPEPGDGNQAALERVVTEWLEDRGHEASDPLFADTSCAGSTSAALN